MSKGYWEGLCELNPTPCPFCNNIEFYNIFDHLRTDHFNPDYESINQKEPNEIIDAILNVLSQKLDREHETLTSEIAHIGERLDQVERNLSSQYYWDNKGTVDVDP